MVNLNVDGDTNLHYRKILRKTQKNNLLSPVATGGFGGLSSPKQCSKSPKLKHETLYISGVFVNFYNVNSPAQTCSTPVEDFLAAVLNLLKTKRILKPNIS